MFGHFKRLSWGIFGLSLCTRLAETCQGSLPEWMLISYWILPTSRTTHLVILGIHSRNLCMCLSLHDGFYTTITLIETTAHVILLRIFVKSLEVFAEVRRWACDTRFWMYGKAVTPVSLPRMIHAVRGCGVCCIHILLYSVSVNRETILGRNPVSFITSPSMPRMVKNRNHGRDSWRQNCC
jgi:hypothetical protein